MAIKQAECVRSLVVLLIFSLLYVVGQTCAATSPAADAPQGSPTSPAAAGNKQPAKKESWWRLMHDPKDGKLDTSRWLLEHKGALRAPIIITEPAVGNGGGVTAVFFHPPSQSQESRDAGERIPPGIYGVAAMKTENGSNAYGLGGAFHFDDDRWRYKGGIGKASFNLDYYTQGQLLAPQKIGYNLDGIFSFQQVSRRLGSSNIYLSAGWIYLDIDSRLNLLGNDQFFKSSDFSKVSSGVGTVLEYDSRNNTLTPSSGWLSMIEATYHSPTFGGDNTYESYRTHTLGHLPLGPAWVLGLRADYRAPLIRLEPFL